MAAPGQPRAPVATGGFLMLLWAFYSDNFIYSRFPPTARSGPSSPSRARLSSSSSGCFLGRKGIRDRYREEPFPRTSFGASVREAHFRSTGPRTGKLCGVKGEGNPSNFNRTFGTARSQFPICLAVSVAHFPQYPLTRSLPSATTGSRPVDPSRHITSLRPFLDCLKTSCFTGEVYILRRKQTQREGETH